MATIQEKLAESLAVLKSYQDAHVSPYVSRIRLMWMQMREVVLATLKVKPMQQDAASVLAMMDATYVKDSYNSLSIEGYTSLSISIRIWTAMAARRDS